MATSSQAGRAAIGLETLAFAPDEWVPNSALPVLVYRDVVAGDDSAAGFEALFSRHGWPPDWRDGIYDFDHYHSTAHEALGFARGSGRLVLGGPHGRAVDVVAGDALLLPAGTGHRRVAASDDFLVVGAYPAGQHWDIRRDAATAETIERMRRLPFPASDPVTGSNPPLAAHWTTA